MTVPVFIISNKSRYFNRFKVIQGSAAEAIDQVIPRLCLFEFLNDKGRVRDPSLDDVAFARRFDHLVGVRVADGEHQGTTLHRLDLNILHGKAGLAAARHVV